MRRKGEKVNRHEEKGSPTSCYTRNCVYVTAVAFEPGCLADVTDCSVAHAAAAALMCVCRSRDRCRSFLVMAAWCCGKHIRWVASGRIWGVGSVDGRRWSSLGNVIAVTKPSTTRRLPLSNPRPHPHPHPRPRHAHSHTTLTPSDAAAPPPPPLARYSHTISVIPCRGSLIHASLECPQVSSAMTETQRIS